MKRTGKKQYAITYLHYVLALRGTIKEAVAYAKQAEKDREILSDMSQRDFLGHVSDYISISDVTGQDV
jgi:hypothetical protein